MLQWIKFIVDELVGEFDSGVAIEFEKGGTGKWFEEGLEKLAGRDLKQKLDDWSRKLFL